MADYAYNFDHRGCPEGGINYNLATFEDISAASGVITEPVTLAEVKNAMRLEGWDNSGEFDFDDDYIEDQITAGRQFCEAKTGCSLIPKTIRAYITNGLGGVSMPAGPLTGTVTMINETAVAIPSDQIKLFGGSFPQLRTPIGKDMTAEYEAGYTASNIPKGLKDAIISYVLEAYEHRGDEQNTIPLFKTAATKCKPYIKYSAWG